MRTHSFRRKKRLGSVKEEENEPEEEPSPYTSQTLRLATVQSGAYVAWGGLGGAEGPAGGARIWELREHYSQDTHRLVDSPLDNGDEDDDDETIRLQYEDEVLRTMRLQLSKDKQAYMTLKELIKYKKDQDRKEWASAVYKLTSLEGRGEAELIRYLFVYTGVPYEDDRLTPEQWEELKPTTVYNKLPIISKCGRQWGETGAIVRMLARKYLLMGVTNDEHMVIEATYDRLRRLKRDNSLAINWVIGGEKNKEKMEWAQGQLLHVILPPAIKEWEALIRQTPGPYLVASGLTLADLAIADFLDQCSSHLLIDPLMLDHLAVSDLVMTVRRIPRILAYLDDRPEDD